MKAKNIVLVGVTVCMGLSSLISCQEEGLTVSNNDVSYIGFTKDMSKDTTRISFESYSLEEGQEVKIAEIPIEVSIRGKIQDKDLNFTIGIDEGLSTLPLSQCILPEKCTFDNGQLLDTVYVKLKNSADLKKDTKYLVLKINASGEVSESVLMNSRAVIAVTDRLVKPDWWEYKDLWDGTYSSVDWYYLGDYSEVKHRWFLRVLQTNDDEQFDGKDRTKLRKYSLELKYMIAEYNAEHPNAPLRDDNNVLIEVPVAG